MPTDQQREQNWCLCPSVRDCPQGFSFKLKRQCRSTREPGCANNTKFRCETYIQAADLEAAFVALDIVQPHTAWVPVHKPARLVPHAAIG
jgi:hypothetical protein